uniref:MARVEL domain-containing protein n=1 Tax=Pelusios castaneus TaxID=367368 RepID=A0A8C8SQY5_9SAUR
MNIKPALYCYSREGGQSSRCPLPFLSYRQKKCPRISLPKLIYNLLSEPSVLFSLIVFASLVTDGYQNLTSSSQLLCVLNDNGVACSYAITAGVLAFLQSFLFLALDAYDIISHKVKSVFLSLDLTFSIIWSCIWFVGFCFLANQWNRSTHHYLLGSSSARASIAFAFFSIPCWVRNSHFSLSAPVLSRMIHPVDPEIIANLVPAKSLAVRRGLLRRRVTELPYLSHSCTGTR